MADVSVRPARAGDVPEIARIQLETWRTAYSKWLPESVLAAIGPEQAEALWSGAVTSPPSSQHHVVVAQEKDAVVGFAAFGPAADDDDGPEVPAGAGQVQTMLVEPRWGRRGHGSRLLAAAVDTMRLDGVTTALVWLPEPDKASAAFFESAGWGPDGYARTLETDGLSITELRLHASLAES